MRDLTEPDTDTIFEQYWETYINYCHREGLQPDMSQFQVWYEDQPEGTLND